MLAWRFPCVPCVRKVGRRSYCKALGRKENKAKPGSGLKRLRKWAAALFPTSALDPFPGTLAASALDLFTPFVSLFLTSFPYLFITSNRNNLRGIETKEKNLEIYDNILHTHMHTHIYNLYLIDEEAETGTFEI